MILLPATLAFSEPPPSAYPLVQEHPFPVGPSLGDVIRQPCGHGSRVSRHLGRYGAGNLANFSLGHAGRALSYVAAQVVPIWERALTIDSSRYLIAGFPY